MLNFTCLSPRDSILLPCSPPLENDCHRGLWHTTGSISLHPLVYIHPLLVIISWSMKTISCLSSWPQHLTQARHRTITTQMDDTGKQRTTDFKEWVVRMSPSPGTERNPQDLAIQGSPVTWPGNLVECQGQEPDGSLCQLLWKFHRTEIVSGDNILKAHKIQKYL